MFKTIKYGEHQSQIGDLYLPLEECLGQDKWPACILISTEANREEIKWKK